MAYCEVKFLLVKSLDGRSRSQRYPGGWHSAWKAVREQSSSEALLLVVCTALCHLGAEVTWTVNKYSRRLAMSSATRNLSL